jgi:hypothetical protein
MFRINGKKDFLVDVETVEQIGPVIRNAEPGEYHIEEIRAKPLTSGHSLRRCGMGFKEPDGAVMIVPNPREK